MDKARGKCKGSVESRLEVDSSPSPRSAMHGQMRAIRRNGYPALSRRSSCTPTYSDHEEDEEEADTSEADLSDYYSDSSYPSQPRPKSVLFPLSDGTNREAAITRPCQRSRTAELRGGRKQLRSDSHVQGKRQAVAAGSTGTTSGDALHSKAFNKLRALGSSRVTPVCSPERERPQSSLATTSISANGKATPTAGGQLSPVSQFEHESDLPPSNRQLRSRSLNSGDAVMAQAKVKKAKKAARTLSFSFGSGSGDKRKRALSIFGSLSRRSGDAFLDQTVTPSSPILGGRTVAGRAQTTTIYEETGSLSSVEEEAGRRAVRLRKENRFGSCRELATCGRELATCGREPKEGSWIPAPLPTPTSKARHKRPSLPSFGHLRLNSRHSNPTPTHAPSRDDIPPETHLDHHPSSPTSLTDQGERETHPSTEHTPTNTSPLPRLRLRKLSDPGGSAPSSPTSDPGCGPEGERRSGFEERGVARGSRPIRKGFTFHVSGDNDWVRGVREREEIGKRFIKRKRERERESEINWNYIQERGGREM